MPLYDYLELPSLCDGRLSLTTAVAVTTSDVTGAGTLYYTPFAGNRIALYSGAAWYAFKLAECSLALTLTSGKNYDVFAYNNAGALALELEAAWTSDTARANALATQDGVLVKTGDATRRYVGTIRASGTNTTEDSAAKRFVWNWANQQPRPLYVAESTDSWTYTTATYRQANGAAGNQVDVVCGQPTPLDLVACGACANTTVAQGGYTAIGESSTTVPDALCGPAFWSSPVTGFTGFMYCHLRKVTAIGRYYYAWLERATAATGTTTWRGDNGDVTLMNNGLRGYFQG